jgi:NADPH:quinone reductase-like Zn-dependent oxidoreductase
MQASVNYVYGPPSVLRIEDVKIPEPGDNEILIRVKAATVNRTDTGFLTAEYFIARFFTGLFKPRFRVLGSEFSGVIEKVGKKVRSFKPGDDVFGLSAKYFGAHAEFLVLHEEATVVKKPKNLSFEQAACIGDGAYLAWNYIRRIDFKEKPKLLINGASGSIGISALQLAKYKGADITAVAQNRSLDLIRSLGVAKVIDYEQEDFTTLNERFDVIFDAVGKSSFGKCKHLLKSDGIYYSTELGPNSENVWLPVFSPFLGGKKVGFPIPKDTREDFEFYAELAEKGIFKPIIDSSFPFEKIREAYEYVLKQRKIGSVVITF